MCGTAVYGSAIDTLRAPGLPKGNEKSEKGKRRKI
jgi:hypothetical protein